MKNKKILGFVIILVAVALTLLIAGKIGGIDNDEKQSTVNSGVNALDATEVHDAVDNNSTEQTEALPEIDTDEETAAYMQTEKDEEITIPEETAITAKVVEVTAKDSKTDVIVMENKDGDTVTAMMGVEQSGGGGYADDDDEENEIPDETMKQPEETIIPEEETKNIVEEPTVGEIVIPDHEVTYQEYEAMSGQEQLLFYYSFANAEEFNEWYNNAKAEYEASMDIVYVGEGASAETE